MTFFIIKEDFHLQKSNFSFKIKLKLKERKGIFMKRVKAACIIQTLHFLLKEDATHDYAIQLVQAEVAKYKRQLDKSQTKYRILSETTQPDGSIIIEIKKQYNTSPVGNYLD
jgi:hypothetical protein